ncbi:MAG: PH domain-containing protein [Candidatus Thorarchaeota archaeon]
MSRDYESRVIKPPMQKIESGRVFKPASSFLWKCWFATFLLGVFIYTICMAGWLGIGYIVIVLDDGNSVAWFLSVYVAGWWPLANLILITFISIIALPLLIMFPLYIRRFEYSVISESGDSMPEIYVKKGLINITKKHVPFRTITNISSRAGPLDRLFGIGNVEIQTAGFSGGTQQGPEEKLEGIVFYEEVRDFILQELRKFRTPYGTATEIPGISDSVRRPAESVSEEILDVLHEIRDILKRDEQNK